MVGGEREREGGGGKGGKGKEREERREKKERGEAAGCGGTHLILVLRRPKQDCLFKANQGYIAILLIQK
jgi:hypothetical protein